MRKLFTALALAAMVCTTSVTLAQATQSSTTQTQHMTKAGTPDKRYKENKTTQAASTSAHMTKSGQPDKRYKDNKVKPLGQSGKKGG